MTHPTRRPDQQTPAQPGAGECFTATVEDWWICPCGNQPRFDGFHNADAGGRIGEDASWTEHQTVTCGRCGRYGCQTDRDPVTGRVPVAGVAELPAACGECGAAAGQGCLEPFCPGSQLPAPSSGGGAATTELVERAARDPQLSDGVSVLVSCAARGLDPVTGEPGQPVRASILRTRHMPQAVVDLADYVNPRCSQEWVDRPYHGPVWGRHYAITAGAHPDADGTTVEIDARFWHAEIPHLVAWLQAVYHAASPHPAEENT